MIHDLERQFLLKQVEYLGDRNIGAMTVIKNIMADTDGDLHASDVINGLYELEIRGEGIWVLWKHRCESNVSRFETLLSAWTYDVLSSETIRRYADPMNRREEAIDFDELARKVKTQRAKRERVTRTTIDQWRHKFERSIDDRAEYCQSHAEEFVALMLGPGAKAPDGLLDQTLLEASLGGWLLWDLRRLGIEGHRNAAAMIGGAYLMTLADSILQKYAWIIDWHRELSRAVEDQQYFSYMDTMGESASEEIAKGTHSISPMLHFHGHGIKDGQWVPKEVVCVIAGDFNKPGEKQIALQACADRVADVGLLPTSVCMISECWITKRTTMPREGDLPPSEDPERSEAIVTSFLSIDGRSWMQMLDVDRDADRKIVPDKAGWSDKHPQHPEHANILMQAIGSVYEKHAADQLATRVERAGTAKGKQAAANKEGARR